MWNNYTVDMQNPGRMADRQAEARAQRLADEASSADPSSSWLMNGVRAIRHSGAVLVTSVRHVHVRSGSALGHSHGRP